MIPRYQRILFWTMAFAILLMAGLLARGCEKAHARLNAIQDDSPIAAPIDAPEEPTTLELANDANGFITQEQRLIALPHEPSGRARALLERLLTDYALPGSVHPLPAGSAVADVFFLDLPGTHTSYAHPTGAQLAVVNLKGSFADAHPSGIESEELTLRSIIGTLHTNFPMVEQVRFVVDGQPRDTLNGHADLSQPYPAVDTVDHPLHNLAPDGTRQ
ncbi:Sporulation and spore germination [Granulicella rosea]|uniref:Sporulation and spore germination n=1 Tax=Granulicella rosea TaxID=474952 RepID=A0A239IG80_9BACT|nr:GerMN domain-containing protein [Granulicella rosea]SNS92575.1 Sporulation and spore germination [Granulicella rosea]